MGNQQKKILQVTNGTESNETTTNKEELPVAFLKSLDSSNLPVLKKKSLTGEQRNYLVLATNPSQQEQKLQIESNVELKRMTGNEEIEKDESEFQSDIEEEEEEEEESDDNDEASPQKKT